MMLAKAGQCVKATRHTIAGKSSSQPCSVEIRRLFISGIALVRSGRRDAPRPEWSEGGSAVRLQNALGLSLRIVERLSRRLRSGQSGLQSVVQRFGDPLVLMGREFGDREFQLIAGDRRLRE